MSTELELRLTAYDEASSVFAGASDNIVRSLTDVENATDSMVKKTDDASNQMTTDYAAISGASDAFSASAGQVKTSVFDMGNTMISSVSQVESLETMQYRLDRAHVQVEKSARAVGTAQDAYNVAVAKFGANSPQAITAANNLKIAQDAHNVAVERSNNLTVQQDIQFAHLAMNIIPQMISAIGGIIGPEEAATAAQWGLNTAEDACPILPVISLISLLVSALFIIPGALGAVTGAFEAAGNAMNSAFGGASRKETGEFFRDLLSGIDPIKAKLDEAAAATTAASTAQLAYVSAENDFSQALVTTQQNMTGYQEILGRTCITAGDFTKQHDDATAASKALDDTITGLTLSCDNTNATLQMQIAHLTGSSELMLGMGQHGDYLSGSEANLGSQIADLNGEISSNNAATATQIQQAIDLKAKLDEEATKAADAAKIMVTLSDSYNVLQAQADASLGQIKTSYDAAFNAGNFTLAEKLLQDFADQHQISIGEAKTIMDSYKDTVEIALQKAQAAFSAFTDTVKTQYGQQQAAADSNLGAIKQRFEDAFNKGDYDTASAIVASFASKYGISLGQAEADIKGFTDKATAAMSAFTGSLEAEYGKQEASAFSNLGAVKAHFEAAFNAGNFDTAADIVSSFASKFGISMAEAKTIIEGFKGNITEIPQTLQQQLVGEGQGYVDAFKRCAGGKFQDLGTDSKTAMGDLVGNTNDLIKNGLVGQAQDNIKAFVDCSTGKQAKMVTDIDGYLTKMHGDYDANIKKVNDLVSQGKTDEAAIYEAQGPVILGKIQQLEDWRNQIVTSAWTATNKTVGDGLGTMNTGIDAAIAKVQALAATFGQIGGATGQDIARAARQVGQTPGAAEGAIVSSPTLLWAGEKGPEAIMPLDRLQIPERASGSPITVIFQQPLVKIEGSADKKTVDVAVDLAVSKIKEVLKTVVVEATSSGAPATSKRIRSGALF